MVRLPVKLPLHEDISLGDNWEQIIRKFSNLGLLYNKYPLIWTDKDNLNVPFQTDFKYRYKNEKGKEVEEKINLKHRFLQEISTSFDKSTSDSYLKEFIQRQISLSKNLEKSGFKVKSFSGMTEYRLIIGLGGAHVLETGLTLHPLYGFPYIPASSVKGIARAYAEMSKEASEDELREIFGSEDKNKVLETNREGKVVFLDGLPTEFPKLEIDIMNPHYGDYYQGNKPPADYLSPNPITFLTVATGQEFSFLLFSKDVSLVEKAEQWLKEGLSQLGAGGKTNVGYGYFKIVEQQQAIEDKTIKEELPKTRNLQTGDLLRRRLRTVKNSETFSNFVKQLKAEDLQELQQISFNDMKSVINIGLAPILESLEISNEIKQIVAKKMLEVCKKPEDKYTEKLEKYIKLLLMAGEKVE
ncbi:MAG: type III-B CRISPR module RAMP protein Cmr6 [Nitrospirota bacterium]